MKIPRKIKIACHKVKISFVRGDKDPLLSDKLGYADLSQNKIVIRSHYDKKPLAESTIAEVFFHEILHFISYLYGIPVNETKNNQLAGAILQVIRDNKLNFTSEE